MGTLIGILYAVGVVIARFATCFYVSRTFTREGTKGGGWVIHVIAILWPFAVVFLVAEWSGKLFAYGPEWVIDRMRKPAPKPAPEPEAKDEYR